MTVDLHLILADSLGLILIVRFPSFEVSPLALVVHFLPYSALAASVNLITSIISIIRLHHHSHSDTHSNHWHTQVSKV